VGHYTHLLSRCVTTRRGLKDYKGLPEQFDGVAAKHFFLFATSDMFFFFLPYHLPVFFIYFSLSLFFSLIPPRGEKRKKNKQRKNTRVVFFLFLKKTLNSQAPSPESNPNSPSPVKTMVGHYPTIES
jgi:hypothetical protein